MLNNDFRNPDPDRLVDRFFEYEPRVGVIGDIHEPAEVNAHVAAAREIQAARRERVTPELVPGVFVIKCREVINEYLYCLLDIRNRVNVPVKHGV